MFAMADNKLHTAVRYGNEGETLQALKEGFNPNDIGMLRWSPVHEAAHNGERDILKLLLLYKGDIHKKDGLHGNTPLHYAAQEDNSACVTVLLNAGAQWDVQNDRGKTPLDIATSSCKERMEPFLNSNYNTDEWQPGRVKNDVDGTKGVKTKGEWEGLDDVPVTAAIGSIHLSFEYNKSILKVRVWQLTDLLLPPPQTSMIESIFVRGYFIPDPAKKSQRKTEDVLVDPFTKDVSRRPTSPPQGGIQHIFTPSSFRFNNPLLYTGVTEDMVSKRSIQLEVCMTQKHTRKPFLMAMIHMPLRTAVRRPIREKYPLIPCMNYTIPNSMRVYNAKEIFVEGTSETRPAFSRSDSSQSNPDLTYPLLDLPVYPRDVHLESIQMDTPSRKHISVNMSDSYEDNLSDNGQEEDEDEEDIDDGIGSSLDVKICSGKGSASSSVTVDVDTSLNEFGDMNLKNVVIHRSELVSKETSIVDMEKVCQSLDSVKGQKKKKIIPIGLSVNTPDEEEVVNRDKLSGDQSEKSVTIEVEDSVKETVVDMCRLHTDTILDIDSGYDNESVKSGSPVSETKDKLPKRKKKIIPIEINNSLGGGEGSDEKEENNNVVDKGNNDSGKGEQFSTSKPRILVHSGTLPIKEDEEVINREINSTRLHSSSSQVSSDSPKEKSSLAGSRPGTPVWDYYDFCDEGSSQDGQNVSANPASDSTIPNAGENQQPSSPTAVNTTSTLQESLERLSRPQPVLDTCHVSGPVLPSIMLMEDFEMDEEN